MTQEYTPVSWQDETTSQQGTLINAERLNQMQTAHHYADGFEEVDTAPTAAPGVAYHKVVYCTADSTFYRWDGTQWTKDIDDDTKALLLAHEADHANPHVVTKAQVGLGNCDNTADLDKPVSTATQTALNAKADKATTLAGYGITDAYTKSQADTLLGAKADKSTTYTKTETDTLLAGKADKATTLAGYGIADAYTKSEADTLLGTKADASDTYTKTEADTLLGAKANASQLTDGSVTKVGTSNVGDDTKPIKLVAGVPTAVTYDLAKDSEVVHLAGAETITGAKTFNYTPRGIIYSSATSGYKELFRIPDHANLQTVTCYLVGRIVDKSYDRSARFILALRTTSYKPVLKTDVPIEGLLCTQNADNSVSIWSSSQRIIAYCDILSRGNATSEYAISDYVQVGTLNTGATKPTVGDDYGYVEDSIITDDLVDMNTLDGYAPMVRTTGNQGIAGNKTFRDNATMGAHRVVITTANKWKRIFTTPKRAGGITRTWVFAFAGLGTANTYGALLQMTIAGSTEVPTLTWLVKGSAVPANCVAASVYDGVLNIWSSKSCALSCIGYATRAALEGAQLTAIDEADEYDTPLSDDGFTVKYGAVVE